MVISRQIGRYPILEELGRGGMGVVYRAHDPTLDRPVAIKVLSEILARDHEQISRFEREAKILARFNHPNIATIYGFEESDDGRKFLVLELVEGESLAVRLRRGRMPVPESLAIARQVAAALVAAHRREIIHRDLKPENVFLTPEGVAKVLDFGLAKRIEAPPAAGATRETVLSVGRDTADVEVGAFHTRAGVAMGTPSYMSPEQVRGETLDQATDIFAFGCLLFECLAGAKAFEGKTLADFIAATLTAEPNWSRLPPEAPERIEKLVRRSLEKSRAARLHDAQEALSEIEAALGTPGAMRSSRAAAASFPNNLPRPLSSFVGRAAEIESSKKLLEGTRLLTLTGSGGSGKTRLALKLVSEVIEAQPHGAWYIDLAPVSSTDQVPSTVMTALGLREEVRKPLLETIAGFLADKDAILVLDNCEHLVTACAQLVDEVLRRSTSIKVIATSREGLGLAGETIYLVPSLSVPRNIDSALLEEIEAFESVQLFVDRARAARPGFRLDRSSAAHVARICSRLDGIPLAIELAAARVRSMSPEEISLRLGENIRILTGGSRTALPRQQTMHAAFDWSYSLLIEEERLLFRRLSIFAGGFTLAAAEKVCAAGGGQAGGEGGNAEPSLEEWQVLDLLSALVEKSLVSFQDTSDGHGRYRLLEMGRQFGREELLKRGGGDVFRDRHLQFFLDLAEESEKRLVGPEQGDLLDRLDLEGQNLKAAFEWCASADGRAEKGLRLAAALWRAWSVRGHFDSGRKVLEEALRRNPGPSPSRAKALNGAGILARYQGDYDASRAFHEESLAISKASGDREGAAMALHCLGALGILLPQSEANLAALSALLEESLAIYRDLGDRQSIARGLNSLGWAAQGRRDLETSRRLYQESLALRKSLGDHHGVGTTLASLALLALQEEDHGQARMLFEESLAIYRRLKAKSGIGWILGQLGIVDFNQGHYDAARSYLEESLVIRRAIKDRPGMAGALADLASLECATGAIERARTHLEESLDLLLQANPQKAASRAIEAAGQLAAAHEDWARSVKLYAAAAVLRESLELRMPGVLQGRHAASLQKARAAVGEESFAEAWSAGRALSYEEAVRAARLAVHAPSPGPRA